MKRLKSKLSAIAMILALAVCACGMSLFAFADTNEPTVDEGGWNTQITRGGVLGDYAGVTHEYTSDGFSKWTGLKRNDKITLSVPFPALEIKKGQLTTNAFRFDVNAVLEDGAIIDSSKTEGTHQISWEMSNVTNEAVLIGAGMQIGVDGGMFQGKPNKRTVNVNGVTAPVMNSGVFDFLRTK